MVLEINSLCKCDATDATFVILIKMKERTTISRLLTNSRGSIGPLTYLLPAVKLFMRPEAGVTREPASADVADEWLFISKSKQDKNSFISRFSDCRKRVSGLTVAAADSSSAPR